MPEEEKNCQPDDYRHLEDMAMKTAAQYFGTELLSFFGISGKVRRTAPTESVHLEARQMYEDFNFEMENGEWYHFEFESDRIRIADLKRFREYEAATSRTYNVPVTTYVVCSANVKKTLSELQEGINTYRVNIVMLKDMDADEIFQKISRKSSGAIEKGDLLPIVLSPLMAGRTASKERIKKGVGYLRETYSKISKDELKKKQAVIYALAVKLLDESELKEIKEAIAMTKLGQMLVEDGMKKGMEQGLEQGMALGVLEGIIQTCKELGVSYKQTVQKIKIRYHFNDEEAEEAVKRYW